MQCLVRLLETMGNFSVLTAIIFLVLFLRQPTLLDAQFQFAVTTGVLPLNAEPRSDSFSVNRGQCALTCMIDFLCGAAFFSSSLSRCFIYESYGEPWSESKDGAALVKVSVAASGYTVSSSYGKMVGSALTVSGNQVGRRSPSQVAANERHCQLLCESSRPTCNIFGFSNFTRECVIFDFNATTSAAPSDPSMYTYYKFSTTLTRNTTSGFSYSILPYDISNISWITFSLQTCTDGHVTLQPSLSTYTTNAYEIPIGGASNTETCFRRVVQGPVIMCIPGIFVSCSSPRQFWISWTGGIIRFGRGNVVGENIVLSYNDAAPYSIRAIGLSGWSGAPGAWWINIPKWN